MTRELELSIEKTSEAFEIIMTGSASSNDIADFLSELQNNGITEDHVIGAVNVMKKKMIEVDIPYNSMDTCGTGGDGKSSLNISTAVAFVLAGFGIPIAKHGNRSITSNCGSADVLNSLKINIDLEVSRLTECIDRTGICFMFAPKHHPAMRHVAEARKILGKLGKKTIFNVLGPLLNPGDVKKQIVGVYDKEVLDIYSKVFKKIKDKKAFIINGFDGMDELSTEGSNIIKFDNNEFILDPNELNIEKPVIDELIGKHPEYNASRIIDIFSGVKDSFYEIVAFNASVGIVLHKDLELNLKNILLCIEHAKDVMDSGAALKTVNNLQKYTQSV